MVIERRKGILLLRLWMCTEWFGWDLGKFCWFLWKFLVFFFFFDGMLLQNIYKIKMEKIWVGWSQGCHSVPKLLPPNALHVPTTIQCIFLSIFFPTYFQGYNDTPLNLHVFPYIKSYTDVICWVLTDLSGVCGAGWGQNGSGPGTNSWAGDTTTKQDWDSRSESTRASRLSDRD